MAFFDREAGGMKLKTRLGTAYLYRSNRAVGLPGPFVSESLWAERTDRTAFWKFHADF